MNHTERIYKLLFSSVYPLYIQKAERKGRTKAEVDTIIYWLTGYTATATAQGVQAQDTACATMTVTLSNGVNLATTPATCWKK